MYMQFYYLWTYNILPLTSLVVLSVKFKISNKKTSKYYQTKNEKKLKKIFVPFFLSIYFHNFYIYLLIFLSNKIRYKISLHFLKVLYNHFKI